MNIGLVTLFILFPFVAISQKTKEPEEYTMPLVDGVVLYTGVINVDSVSKTELYNRAKRFFVKHYKSANDVIQLDDKEAGEIIGKGIFVVPYNFGDLLGSTSTSIRHTFSFSAKDGKYKYEISNLVTDYYASGSGIVAGRQITNPMEVYVLSKVRHQKRFAIDAHDYISNFIQSLIDEMAATKKDDW